eukprot:SAG25_NODE_3362_length_1113_cov_1.688363_1_plen_207_part_01
MKMVCPDPALRAPAFATSECSAHGNDIVNAELGAGLQRLDHKAARHFYNLFILSAPANFVGLGLVGGVVLLWCSWQQRRRAAAARRALWAGSRWRRWTVRARRRRLAVRAWYRWRRRAVQRRTLILRAKCSCRAAYICRVYRFLGQLEFRQRVQCQPVQPLADAAVCIQKWQRMLSCCAHITIMVLTCATTVNVARNALLYNAAYRH